MHSNFVTFIFTITDVYLHSVGYSNEIPNDHYITENMKYFFFI